VAFKHASCAGERVVADFPATFAVAVRGSACSFAATAAIALANPPADL
jgi:hypothetical protein